MVANYSIHLIPVYWVLAMYPHAYAIGLIKKANNNKVDNVNSRSLNTVENYRKSVPSDVFARFERAEAAHKNLLENAPLMIGAIILGNMAKLDSQTLTTVCGAYVALRAVYIATYINTTRQRYSYLRSFNWAVSTGLLFYIFVKAGNKLMY